MVSRILEQQQPLCATLLEIHKTELMPTDVEFNTLEELVTTMKPLVDITEAIGSEKWITISTVQPILTKLMKFHLAFDANDSVLIKTIKKVMLDDLKERYTGHIIQLLTKATLLDPRFKNMKFLAEADRKTAIENLKLDFNLVVQPSKQSTSESDDEPAPKRPKGEQKLLELIGGILENTSEQETPADEQLETEVSRYLGEESTNQSPLEWWRLNKQRYPLLSQLAARYLSIPATSVPCERVFSTAGHVVNEKRACLLPTNVNMLVFLSENLD